jgi:hypothetical protein
MNGLRGKWCGQIVRGGIAVLPLVAVIGLCVVMMGWRGKSDAEVVSHAPRLAPPDLKLNLSRVVAKDLSKDVAADSSVVAEAAFQRLHVLHALVHVPQ